MKSLFSVHISSCSSLCSVLLSALYLLSPHSWSDLYQIDTEPCLMSACIEIAHRQQLFIYRGRMMCIGHVYVRTSVRTIECKQLSAKSKTLKAERCVEVETVQRWVSTIQTQQTDWYLVCSPLSTCSNRLILIKSKKSHMLSGTTTTL